MGKTLVGDREGCAYIEYEAIDQTTAKARLYRIHGRAVWLPISQIVDDDREGIVVIPQWLAEEKELESDW